MPEEALRLRFADCRSPAVCLATLGGVGFASWAPGTWGSLVTGLSLLPLVYLLPADLLQPVLGSLLLLLLGLAAWSVPRVSRLARSHDPVEVVIDEAIGMTVAFSLLPGPLLAHKPLAALLVCFCLFRSLDIIKPWPVALVEALPGMPGVVFDDVLAGLLAGFCAFAFLV